MTPKLHMAVQPGHAPTLSQLWAALYHIAEWEDIAVDDLYTLVVGLDNKRPPEKALTAFVRNYGKRLGQRSERVGRQ